VRLEARQEALPVRPHDGQVTAASEQRPEDRTRLRRRQGAEAGLCRGVPARGGHGRHAGVGPVAPADAQCRQPLLAPMSGQRIETGVGRGIVRMPAEPEQRRGGREQHEEVQAMTAGEPMQRPAADELGGEDRRDPGPVGPWRRLRGNGAGGVHDARQRRQVGGPGGAVPRRAETPQQRGERRLVGHVEGRRRHRHATRAQPLDAGALRVAA